MTDFKKLTDIIVHKSKIRGKPVAVSLFKDGAPDGYEPIQDTPCAIIRYAMDENRKVYFDAQHHDCLVGVHHAGITPGKREIVTGEYLSKTSSFFSEEGASRLKAGTYALPPGMVNAVGAAPLDEVPDGVGVDWIVAVCNPHHANALGGCRLCREGIPPYGTFGTSLCGELFAVPWYIQNVMVVGGDFGGRMHNRIKQDQLFVIIPAAFADYIPFVLMDMKVDIKSSREMTKPAHSPFWRKKKDADIPQPSHKPEEQPCTADMFTMPWNEEAEKLMGKVPEGIREMVAGNAEEYARSNGYTEVSRKSMEEQMEEMGMNLDEMLNDI